MFDRTFALGFFYNCKQYFSYRAHKGFKYLPNVNGELWQTKHEGCTIGKESEIISYKEIFFFFFFFPIVSKLLKPFSPNIYMPVSP